MENNKNMTAVEWLEERLNISFGDEIKPLIGFFVQAKEMEKEQIEDAYSLSRCEWNETISSSEYYNETYGGNK